MGLRRTMLVILCSCTVISCTASRKTPPEWGSQDRSYSTSSATGCPSMGGLYRNQAEWAATNPDLLPGISGREEFNLAKLFQFDGRQSEIETVRLDQFIEDKHKLLVSFLASNGRNVRKKEFVLNNISRKDISIQCSRDYITIRYSEVTPAQTGISFFDHKTIYLERHNDGSLIASVMVQRSPAMLLADKLSYVEYLLRFKIVKT